MGNAESLLQDTVDGELRTFMRIASVVIHFKGNRIKWNYQENSSFSSLHQFVIDQFKIYIFSLKYKNQHRKWVEIHSDKHLDAALKYAIYKNRSMLNVTVVIEHTPHAVPLQKFSVKDICTTIKQWMYNDIDYKKHLGETKNIFSAHELNGKKIGYLSPYDVKCIVKEEMLKFITSETLDIMFTYFENWKISNSSIIASKSAEEVAQILFNFPLQRLIDEIIEQQISGAQIVDILNEKQNNMIQSETGWLDSEVQQIRLLLLKYNSFTKQQIIDNMYTVILTTHGIIPSNYKPSLSTGIYGTYPNDHLELNYYEEIMRIQDIMIHDTDIDIERIHDYIKNNKNNKEMQVFVDKIINMVDELVEKYDDTEDQLVKRVFTTIAKCFICNYDDLELNNSQDWVCCNCGNDNFSQWINNQLNKNLTMCCLCGISQIDAIVLKIRNQDVNDIEDDIKEKDNEKKGDVYAYETIQKVINVKSAKHVQTFLNERKIDLVCLSRNDKIPCPSIMRLAGDLIRHHKWLKKIRNKNNHDIDDTMKVTIIDNINDKTFESIFIESAKSIKKIKDTEFMELFKFPKIFNKLDTPLQTFLEIQRKTFSKELTKYTTVKRAPLGRLYNKIKRGLIKKAFLTGVDLNNVDYDYGHILQQHIHHGNKASIKNVFRFFNLIVHYEDSDPEIEHCISLKRYRKRRDKRYTENRDEKQSEEKQSPKKDNINLFQDKDIFTLKQIYHQTQLDIIHSYLVHSNWTNIIKRYSVFAKEHVQY
eukprot:522238_1